MIIVIGDSHVSALKAANDGEDVKVFWLNRGKGASAKHGDLLPEEAIDLVSRLRPDDLLVVGIVGTYHNIIGLRKHAVPFDTFLPGEDQMREDGVSYVHHTSLLQAFCDQTKKAGAVIDLLRTAKCQKAIMATPPPKNADDLILSRTKKLTTDDLNPAPRRLRLWKLEAEAIEAVANEWGCQYLAPPSDTTDDDGYLSEEYQFDDFAHANSLYGKKVIDQMREYAIATQSKIRAIDWVAYWLRSVFVRFRSRSAV